MILAIQCRARRKFRCRRAPRCRWNVLKSRCIPRRVSVEVLPYVIPLDRAFDVQWNPPGFPELHTRFLQQPYNDRGARDGHYTFAKLNQDGDGEMSFVRQNPDGTVCSVFERVAFRAISETVLMMEGNPDPSWIGSGYGTLIKGKGIPAGDSDGVYDTRPVDTVSLDWAEPERWIRDNFYPQGAYVTNISGPIMSCYEFDEE